MKSNKLKKIIITSLAALVIAGGVAQIGFAAQTDKAPKGIVAGTEEEVEKNVVGKIVAFGENTVEILSGDIPESFKVSNENLKDFYLGETVTVKKLDENSFKLVSFKDSDFNMRYTSMGDPIGNIGGVLKEINEDSFIISQGEADMKIESGYKIEYKVGDYVSVDYTSFAHNTENKVLLDIYNEDTALNLTVKEVTREENGQMVLVALDDAGKELKINVAEYATLFFNHSDIKANDKIAVYHEGIEEGSTTVESKMIQKLQ